MNVIVDDNNNKTIVINKEAMLYFRGSQVITLKAEKLHKEYGRNIVEIIGRLNRWNDNEIKVFHYIIMTCINTFNKNDNDYVFKLDTKAVDFIANKYNISVSTTNRAITSLVNKDVIGVNIVDNKAVNSSYILKDTYNVVSNIAENGDTNIAIRVN